MIATLLKPGGTLLIFTRLRETEETPDGPLWAVSQQELSQLDEYNYQEVSRIPTLILITHPLHKH